MWQTALNTVLAAAVAALAAVLVTAIKAFGDAGVEYIRQKQKELQVKTGTERYNQNLAFAKSAWAIVDEYFRITPTIEKTIGAKQAKFAEEIRKLIPSVTDSEIEQLRQAVAGEVNKGREALAAPAAEQALGK
jgi:hypothetical protein